MRLFYVFVLLGCVLNLTQAQTITIPYTIPQARCAGTNVEVSFATSGTFAANNTFRAQLSGGQNQPFVDVPGSVSGGLLTVTLPANLTPRVTYRMRVVSSNPAVVSNETYAFGVTQSPTVKVLGTSFGTVPVNAYTPGTLNVELSGGSPYTLTLTDSSRFTSYNDAGGQIYLPIQVGAQSSAFGLASVQNPCGYGTVSGTIVSVSINSVNMRVVSPTSSNLCAGGAYQLYFNTDAPLPPNSVFEAELSGGYPATPVTSLSVTGTSSPLTLHIPETIRAGDGYRLRVFSRSAGISAYWSGESQWQRLTVLPKPQLKLSGPPTPVRFGESAVIGLAYTGSPAVAFLDDGTRFTLNRPYSSTYTTTTPIRADKTFRLKSYEGECASLVDMNSVNVTVRAVPGMQIDSLSAKEICAGESLTLYYTTHYQYVVPDKLTVRALPSGQVFTVNKPKAGQLVLTPPDTQVPISCTALQVRDATADTLIRELTQPVAVKAKPLLLGLVRTYTLASSGDVQLTGPFGGAAQTDVTLASGERLTYLRGFPYEVGLVKLPAMYVPTSRTLTISSVRNECGAVTFSDANTLTVNVSESSSITTGLVLRLNSVTGCSEKTARFNVATWGPFAPDNQFQIEVSYPSRNGANTQVQTLAKPDAFSLAFPGPQQGNVSYKVRVLSTNPVLRSNDVEVGIASQLPLSALVNVSTTGFENVFSTTPQTTLTVAAGQSVFTSYAFGAIVSLTDYELLDGTKGVLFPYSPSQIVRIENRPTQTTTYGIRRLLNGCHATPPQLTRATVYVVPGVVMTGSVATQNVCVNTPLSVPFHAVGILPEPYTAVVQVSENKAAWQDVPTTGQRSPLTARLPATLSGKQLMYRVVLRTTGSDLVGRPSTITLVVGTVPNATLSLPSGQSVVQTSNGNSVMAKLSDAGPFSYTAILTDGKIVTMPPSTTTFYTNGSGAFRVGSIYNQCGYGQAQGSFYVRLKPYIETINVKKSVVCVSGEQQVQYALKGDVVSTARVVFSLIGPSASQSVKLTETSNLSGTFTFALGRIPSVKPGGSYSIVAELTGNDIGLTTPNLEKATFSVVDPVSVSMANGPMSVYAGDNVPLTLVSNPSDGSVMLSSGQSVSLINGRGQVYIQPTQTTTYSLVSAQNSCGVGRVSGATTVTVLPATSAVTIRHQPNSYLDSFCTGGSYVLLYKTTGTFGVVNRLRVELSDSTGTTFTPISSSVGASQITVTIPAKWKGGDTYRFRVVSNQPAHVGSTTPSPVTINAAPTGLLTGSTRILKGDSTQLSVILSGTSPWSLTLGTPVSSTLHTAYRTPYRITVRPDTTTNYRLLGVGSTICPNGSPNGTALVTVSDFLSDGLLTVSASPNPTTGLVRVEGVLPQPGVVRFRVVNMAGQIVQSVERTIQTIHYQHELNLSQLPAGVYGVHVETGESAQGLLVVKQ